MRKIVFALGILVALSNSSTAQNIKKCAEDEALLQFQQKEPQAFLRYQQRLQDMEASITPATINDAAKGNAVVTIPIVFHFLLTQAQFNRIGGVAGIQQRVDSQIVSLNRDFNATNPDIANLPAVFASVKGNQEINFVLAHTKPNGAGSPGYEYKIVTDSNYSVSSGSYGSGIFVSDVKYDSPKGFAAWDYTKYLNVWICEISTSGILGICTKPTLTGPNLGDIPLEERGAVVTYGAFGKRRTFSDFYISGNDRGRTLTHELGHYFELNHIWGSGTTCTDDDGVADTRQQFDENFGCPTVGTVFPNCTNQPGGEMWMNYMDYVNDACMIFFSAGQVARSKSQYDGPTKPSYSLTLNPQLGNWPASIKNIASTVQLAISPNPSAGVVTVTYNNAHGKLQQIEVYNVIGAKQTISEIGHSNNGIHTLNLSHLSKGMYIVKCQFEDGIATEKILLQ